MEEINYVRVSVITHTIAGIIVGIFSFYNPGYIAGLAGIVVLLAVGFAVEKLISREKKGMGWWVKNGLILYFFIWAITWVVLFNI